MLKTLYERSLNIAHDMGLKSIAFPMIGSGRLRYSAKKVLEAFLDACSLFRMKDSSLKKVVMLVWKEDKVTEEVRFFLEKGVSPS